MYSLSIILHKQCSFMNPWSPARADLKVHAGDILSIQSLPVKELSVVDSDKAT